MAALLLKLVLAATVSTAWSDWADGPFFETLLRCSSEAEVEIFAPQGFPPESLRFQTKLAPLTEKSKQWERDEYAKLYSLEEDAFIRENCRGEVRIQAMRYDCAEPGNLRVAQWQIKRDLVEEVVNRCDDLCLALGRRMMDHPTKWRRCRGVVTGVSACGLTADLDWAVRKGREACPSKCGGQALAFCSLYDMRFRLGRTAQFAAEEPNCRCRHQAE